MSKSLKQEAASYATADDVRSGIELTVTIVGYTISVAALYIVYNEAWWILYPFVCIIASLFMVKIFTLLHDCSHSSMFSHAIGYHHIHHLNSKIPGYRLRECFDAVSEFRTVKPLSWYDVIEAFRLKVWSYEKNRLVTFDEVPSLKT